MNMKRMLLSVVGCLLFRIATTMASNVLVIHLASGVVERFVLLEEEPTITFSGDNIVIKTSSTEVTYAMETVSYFNYEDNAATSISGVEVADGVRVNGDIIAISGLPAGSKVFVYAAGGQICISEVANENGEATLNITSLARGVYIVNANNISTKITKK